MICQKCGMSNREDALFCEYCGGKIEMPVGRSAAGKKIVLAVELVAIVLLFFLCFRNVSGLFSAEKVGERYFVAMANGDWEEAYAMLEVEESEFINAKTYRQANAAKAFPQMNGYSVRKQTDLKENLLGTTIVITYRQKGDSTDYTYQAPLNRQSGKKYLLFDEWKVSPDQQIAKDCTIQAPQGASVSVDGIMLAQSYLTESQGGFDCYTIPAIFNGVHEVTVTMEGMESETGSFDTAYDSRYSITDMRVAKETLEKTVELSGNALQQVYGAALQGSAYSAVSALFTADPDAGIEESYRDFMEGMQNDEYSRIEAIDMSNISGTASSYMEDGKAVIEVDVPFDYKLDYSYQDWDNAQKSDTYSSSDNVTFYFINENGSWVLNNLGCHTLYY